MKMSGKSVTVILTTNKPAKITKWKVKEGTLVAARQILFIYNLVPPDSGEEQLKFKSSQVGTVRKLIAKEGDVVNPGNVLMELEECTHPTVMADMCAECGADLRKDEQASINASIPMVHSIPELKVSEEQAQIIGKADENRLINDRKLVLLVDLDQTLIHTTNDNIPPNLKDVFHFQLYGPMSPWYHTRIRPRTREFLEEISKHYELHICTFGARNYAHRIAGILDPNGKYFSHRILSRDECFSANSKTANLKALFPCGDNMVCIIDDREDVWNFAPNLIHVKPYHFFKHTGDINAPPGLAKKENDEIDGYDFTNLDKVSKKVPEEPNEKKSSQSLSKAKVDLLGESTTDKDTEDEAEKKETSKAQTNADDIEKVTSDLQLSEDDSEDSNADNNEKDGKKLKQSENPDQTNESAVENLDGTSDRTLIEESTVENVDKTADGSDLAAKESESEEKELSKGDGEKKTDVDCADSTSDKADTRPADEKKSETAEPKTNAEDLIEVEDTDDYLMYLEDILRMIHKAYYQAYDNMKDKNEGIPDLKAIIPEVKGKVLKGCNLVFSGLVPSHIPLQQSRAYMVAVSLGAVVSPDVTPNCTHLVAARSGTAKVNSSRRIKGIHIVTPLWLWHCAERWERLDEKIYPLGEYLIKLQELASLMTNNDKINLGRGSIANRIPPAHCGSPERNAEAEQYSPAIRARTDSGRFIDTINPLLTFSSEDRQIMDKEVEDLFNEDDDDETESEIDKKPSASKSKSILEPEDSSSSSSEDSLSGGNHPKGWHEEQRKSRKRKADTTTCTESDVEEESPSVKFRRGEPLPSDLDLGDDSQDSPGSEEPLDDVDDGDWNMMGAALEREFLSGE